jgi:predicted TPR repeat methyltransferase
MTGEFLVPCKHNDGMENTAAQHDVYAAEYDNQVQAYDCHLTDVLFGLCYAFIQPGQRMLDAGIGSGLSAELFARAGLKVSGMDFSPAMLEVCQAKGIAQELKQHDLQQIPWPYPSGAFDHLVCCGVLHFIPDPEPVFAEARRVLREEGLFAFTSKVAPPAENGLQKYDRQTVGEFAIYSHSQDYLESLIEQCAFERLKLQKCFVGDDLFNLWVVRKKTDS